MCCGRSLRLGEPARRRACLEPPRRLPGERSPARGTARGGGQLAARLNTVLVSGAKFVKPLPQVARPEP